MSAAARPSAFLSDIHGNLVALEAVLADLRQFDPQEVYCLGDVVGYGPNPCECIDLVRQFAQIFILGNHDQAAVFGPTLDWNRAAVESIEWTTAMLTAGLPSDTREKTDGRWEFLSEMKDHHRTPELLCVHGSPYNHLNEYLFGEDIYNSRKMERAFNLVDKLCFQGHTHYPGIFLDSKSGLYGFVPQADIKGAYPLPSGKAMVNVGSVGQPRDRNPDACYVLLRGNEIEFRRVPYDVDETANRIRKITALSDSTRKLLADRLKDGR